MVNGGPLIEHGRQLEAEGSCATRCVLRLIRALCVENQSSSAPRDSVAAAQQRSNNDSMRPICAILVLLAVAECVAVQASSAAEPTKLQVSHLSNAWQLHPQVICGGLPEGDAAFAELATLGVKTIISVDGATPDVPTATKYGLRYVHLPHGYDGIPECRAKELAKAVRDLPSPIYIHCHLGKHRAPAAATVACVGAGLLEPAAAETVLKTAGTGENYRGLYESARAARPIDRQILNDLPADFPAAAKLPPLAESMVAIEKLHGHLLSQPTPHDALLLREQFTELLRSERSRPERFGALLLDSETAAKDLEAALVAGLATKPALIRLSDDCTACHRQFRDPPLREK